MLLNKLFANILSFCFISLSVLNANAQCLTGNYSVGIGADFNSVSSAVSSINNNGVCGPVVFSIIPGNYVNSISIQEIVGSSTTNTITFQSATGNSNDVKIQSNTVSVVDLNGADNIIFKDLTIENITGGFTPTQTNALKFRNNTLNNRFENVQITALPTTIQAPETVLIYFENGDFSNTSFVRCTIKGGNIGMANGSSSTCSNLSILQSEVDHNRGGVLTLNNINGATIKWNTFTNTWVSFSTGVNLLSFEGDLIFENNYISCNKDVLLKIEGSALNGIDSLSFLNNVAETPNSNATIPLDISMVNNGYIVNNSIQGATIYDCSNISLLNNLFVNLYDTALHLVNNVNLLSDYNCFYPKVEYNGITYNTLTSLQGATLMDSNSYYYYPVYNPLYSDSYHLLDVNFNQKGFSTPWVQYDIDGETRETPPDIGADEFILPDTDATILSIDSIYTRMVPGYNTVYATFMNTGILDITSMTGEVLVNNIPYGMFTYSGNIAAGDTIFNFPLDSVEYMDLQDYNIAVNILTVNSVTDSFSIGTLTNTLTKYNTKTRLSGEYVLGGYPNDFSTFAQVQTELSSRGIYSEVTFLIANGTYQSEFYLNGLDKASPDDNITFKSLFGNRDLVHITRVSLGDELFYFRNIDGITFEGLTLEGTTDYVLRFRGICNDIQIIDCKLSHATYSTSSVIYSESGSNYSIYNCIFENSDFGLRLFNGNNINVVNSQFKNQKDAGIRIDSAKNILVEGSEFYSLDSSNYVTGVDLNQSLDTVIIKQNYFQGRTGSGIDISNIASTTTNYIFNNSFSYSGGTTIKLINGSNWNLYNNSLNLHNDTSIVFVSNLLHFSSVSDVNVINNIFSNNTGGGLMSIAPTASVFNYNCFNINGGSITPTAMTFNDWQISGNGINSLEIDPLFINDTNLHILANTQLQNAGAGLDSVKIDLDNEFRSTPPSIGAFKIDSGSTDVELIEVNSLTPTCKNSDDIQVTFKNLGADTLKIIEFNYVINAQDTIAVVWNGSLEPNGQINDYTIGHYNFYHDSVYSMNAWLSYPNNTYDLDNSNDTLYSDTVNHMLGGAFTVAGEFPDFETIQEAVNTLEVFGVCDSIVLNLRTYIYSNPVNIPAIFGVDSTTSLTIQSEALNTDSVQISVVTLDSTDNIRFVHLSCSGINLYNNNKNILVDSCSFISAYGVIIEDGFNRDITIKNSYFEVSGFGVSNNHPTNNPDSYIGPLKNIRIENNYFLNTNSNSNSNHYRNLEMWLCENLYVINNVFTSNCTMGVSDVFLNACTGDVKIINNDLEYNLCTYDNISAMALANCVGTQLNPIEIKNNTFSVYANTNNYVTGIPKIMKVYNSTNIDFHHNSMSNSTGHGIALFQSKMAINNNIFELYEPEGTGYSDRNFIETDSLSNITSCNNNVYHKVEYPRDNIGAYEHLPLTFEVTSSNSIWSFSDWKLNTGFDNDSHWGDPQFTSNLDLHINQNNISPYLASVPVGVTYDMDSELRDVATPIIGADEYIPHSDNANLGDFPLTTLCTGNQNINVVLVNSGTSTLTNVNINWQVDGVAQSPLSWSGALASTDSVEVTVGTFNIVPNNIYNITSWTDSPNGNLDPYTEFDTISAPFKSSYSGIYTVQGVAPDFINLQSAIDSLNKYGVCGNVTLNIRPGTYVEYAEITHVQGTNDSINITIQSENQDSSSVLLLNDITHQHVFVLDSADHIRIQHLRIQKTTSWSTGGEGGIGFIQSSNDIIIRNNYLLSEGESLISTAGVNSLHKNLYIDNNNIFGGSVIIDYPYVINHPFYVDQNLFIRNNIIDGQTEVPIRIYGNNSVVSGNTVLAYGASAGILTSDNGDLLEINNNRIYGDLWCKGIWVVSNHDQKNVKIYNNEIAIISDTINYGMGIEIYEVDSCKIINNSIHISGSNPNVAINLINSPTQILNNQLISKNGGALLNTSNSPLYDIDYNNYFTTGNIGTIEGAIVTDLNGLMGVTLQDSNSIFVDPNFVLDSVLISQNDTIVDKALSQNYITHDIDLINRGNAPDIGAYEINNFNLDVGAVALNISEIDCYDSLQFDLEFSNFGFDDVLTFGINLIINNDTILVNDWSGVISQNDTANYYLTTINSSMDSSYNITLELTDPNGGVDQFIYNNTITTMLMTPATEYFTSFTICEGDSLQVFGNYESIQGIYIDSLFSVSGCDSIIVNELIVHNNLNYQNPTIELCQSDSVLIFGNYQFTSGIYWDSLQTTFGCDSIFQTELIVHDEYEFQSPDIIICYNDSVLIYGNYEMTPGIYYDSLQSVFGCDSVFITTLIVSEPVTISTFNPSITCVNSPDVSLPAGSPTGGSFSGTGVSGNVFSPTISGGGDFHIVYTYTDTNQCTNSDSTSITVDPCTNILELTDMIGLEVFPNPTADAFTISKQMKTSQTIEVYLYDINSKLLLKTVLSENETSIKIDVSKFEKGIYNIQLIVGAVSYSKRLVKI